MVNHVEFYSWNYQVRRVQAVNDNITFDLGYFARSNRVRMAHAYDINVTAS